MWVEEDGPEDKTRRDGLTKMMKDTLMDLYTVLSVQSPDVIRLVNEWCKQLVHQLAVPSSYPLHVAKLTADFKMEMIVKMCAAYAIFAASVSCEYHITTEHILKTTKLNLINDGQKSFTRHKCYLMFGSIIPKEVTKVVVDLPSTRVTAVRILRRIEELYPNASHLVGARYSNEQIEEIAHKGHRGHNAHKMYDLDACVEEVMQAVRADMGVKEKEQKKKDLP